MKPLRHGLDVTIRPRLLVVAARHALAGYNRDTTLPRVLGLPLHTPLMPSEALLETLIAREAAMNDARCSHQAGWRAGDHVLLIAALLHEAQLFDVSACQAVA
ncbi:MAG: DUF6477 family protein [Roseinatronobacter sp.]